MKKAISGASRIMHGWEKFPTQLIRATAHEIRVNWALTAQAAHLAEIDGRAYWSGWQGSDFKEVHGRKDWTTIVAEVSYGTHPSTQRHNPPGWQTALVGYLVCELFAGHIEVRRMAVEYPFRRLGVGSALIQKAISALTPGKREQLIVEVDEINVEAQLFLKAHEFLMIKRNDAPIAPFTCRDPNAGDIYTFLYTCYEQDRKAALSGELLL